MVTQVPKKPTLINPVVVKKPLAKVWGAFDEVETEGQTQGTNRETVSFKFTDYLYSEKETKSMSATGSLSFSTEPATKVATSAIETTANLTIKAVKGVESITASVRTDILGDLIGKQILGLGVEKPKEKTPEQQKKEAEAQFTISRQQDMENDKRRVEGLRRQSLSQKIQMISSGEMSLMDVIVGKNVNVSAGMAGETLQQNLGESDVHFTWRKRQEQKIQAEDAKKKTDTKTPGKAGLSELNKRYEGAGTMGTDAVG